MSRALTVYTRDKHKDPEVENVMDRMKCSEPVARNMLKMRKLGLGPLAGGEAGEEMRRSPPRLGATGASINQDKKRRLQEQEQRLRENEDFTMFERVEKAPKAGRHVVGIAKLGAVEKRHEAVDPLEKKVVSREPVEQETAEDRDKREKLKELADRAKQEAIVKRARQEREEQERKRQGKKRKKRRRGGDGEFGSEESDIPNEDETAYDAKAKQRSVSPEREVEKSRSAASSGVASSSGGGLMTEAEVLARMGKNKDKEQKSQRGSYRAKSRIQKEWEEWELTKRGNHEYNKAPKFALCFSAETGKNKRF